MDYSYRNNRNRRMKARNRQRGIAVLTVCIMAALLFSGYGLINLLLNKGEASREKAEVEKPVTEEKEGDSSTPILISEAETEEKTGQETEEKTGQEAEEETEEVLNTGEGEEKKLSKKKGKKKTRIKYSIKTAEKYFRDTAFIGDSRTQGLQLNAGFRSADFLAGKGLNVSTAFKEKLIKGSDGELRTVIEALEKKDYKKIYICFGINELGWPNVDVFVSKYKDLILAVKEKQKESELVVYGILPVTKAKSDNHEYFNMKNVKRFNKKIKAMAEEIGITYADLSPSVADKDGFLPDGVTPDGIHMNREYCRMILSYMVEKKI